LIERLGLKAQCECTNPCDVVMATMLSPLDYRLGGLNLWK
jgi:hypothetical protein